MAARKPTRGAKATAKARWTVAVYMAGDNNLDGSAYKDLVEMKKVGSTGDVTVVAQLDSLRARGCSRYRITKGSRTTLAKDVVKKLGTQNTGDPKGLIDFMRWVATEAPAERYLLVLWNHGQGWDDTDIYADERTARTRGGRKPEIRHALFRTSVKKAKQAVARGGVHTRAILLDDGAKDFLDNVELKQAIVAARRALGQPIDLFGMDACLMNQAEVAYQVCNEARFMVGSELTEPTDGWPYDVVLAKLARNPAMTAAELAKIIVQEYIASYRGAAVDVTQSAVDLSASPGLARAVSGLADALRAGLANANTRDAISLARLHVQPFDDNLEANVDLGHLCRLLDVAAMSPAIRMAARDVLQALGRAIVASGRIGSEVPNASGVAIYFPHRSISPLYANLDWAKRTTWPAFLRAFCGA
jgi:hypothetical protein